jgi:hypothetical protein
MTQHEIASDGTHWHLITQRKGLPFVTGIATARCGTTGWLGKSAHIEEKIMCIRREKLPMCALCMKVLQRTAIVKHDKPPYIDYIPVGPLDMAIY